MRVLSADQPHPQLMVTHQPCVDPICPCQDGDTCHYVDLPGSPAMLPRRAMVKRIHTSTYPFPYLGERVAIHATKKGPTGWRQVGDWNVDRYGMWLDGRDNIDLPLGAIVGSCVITASLPILGDDVHPPEGWDITQDTLFVCTNGGHPGLWRDSDYQTDLSDQLPFGDFTPGMHAWILEDAAPTTERCPGCRGVGEAFGLNLVCVCGGAGYCPPIPWTHPGGRLPEWTTP